MSDESLHNFLKQAATRGVRQYLEVGCREGDSLRQVAENSRVLTKVVICDLWGSDYGGTGRGDHRHVDRLLDDCHYTGERVFLDGDSAATVPTITDSFDLVLVDGDHSDDGAWRDLSNCWPLVRAGGILAFHDIAHPAHPTLRSLFNCFFAGRRDCDVTVEILDGHGIGVAWKNTWKRREGP